jgi:hypothetical protein
MRRVSCLTFADFQVSLSPSDHPVYHVARISSDRTPRNCSIDAALKHDIMMMGRVNAQCRYRGDSRNISEMCVRASNKYVGRMGL